MRPSLLLLQRELAEGVDLAIDHGFRSRAAIFIRHIDDKQDCARVAGASARRRLRPPAPPRCATLPLPIPRLWDWVAQAPRADAVLQRPGALQDLEHRAC